MHWSSGQIIDLGKMAALEMVSAGTLKLPRQVPPHSIMLVSECAGSNKIVIFWCFYFPCCRYWQWLPKLVDTIETLWTHQPTIISVWYAIYPGSSPRPSAKLMLCKPLLPNMPRPANKQMWHYHHSRGTISKYSLQTQDVVQSGLIFIFMIFIHSIVQLVPGR